MKTADVMSAIDRNQKDFYSNLTPDERKTVGMWIVMRSASSAASNPEHYLLLVNDLVNVDFTAIYKHPELQWKLLSLCGIGKNEFHPWIAPSKKKKKNKLEEKISEMNPAYSADEVQLFLAVNTEEDIIEYFISCGLQQDDIKEFISD